MATVDEGVPTLDGEVPAGPVDGLEGRRGGVQAAGDQVDQRGGRQDHPAPSAFRIVVAAQRQRRAADDAARHRQRRRRRAAVACPSRRPPQTEKERKKKNKRRSRQFCGRNAHGATCCRRWIGGSIHPSTPTEPTLSIGSIFPFPWQPFAHRLVLGHRFRLGSICRSINSLRSLRFGRQISVQFRPAKTKGETEGKKKP